MKTLLLFSVLSLPYFCNADDSITTTESDPDSCSDPKTCKADGKTKTQKDTPEPSEVELREIEEGRKRRGDHLFLTDYVLEHAQKVCRAVSWGIAKRAGLNVKKRCEWFVDIVEEFIGETLDQIMHTVEHTMLSIVDNAAHSANYHDLIRHLSKTAKFTLDSNKTPKEKAIRSRLNEALHMWVINVVTMQKAKGQDTLPPSALKYGIFSLSFSYDSPHKNSNSVTLIKNWRLYVAYHQSLSTTNVINVTKHREA